MSEMRIEKQRSTDGRERSEEIGNRKEKRGDRREKGEEERWRLGELLTDVALVVFEARKPPADTTRGPAHKGFCWHVSTV